MTDAMGQAVDGVGTIVTGAAQDRRVGTDVAGYHIDRLLGHGGMAVVYLARDRRLGRQVALKVISTELASDERFRARFIAESRSAASIDHPNVVPVYEAGEADGLLFIAMRYVNGEDLHNHLRRQGRLDVGVAVDIVAQVGMALDCAHAAGLVHRDVKPANVLLTSTGDGCLHAYLTDFGIAQDGHGSGPGPAMSRSIIGTVDYMAPEQILGQGADSRADVYALGCVLHECLAGMPPYSAADPASMMYAHVHAPIPRLTAVRRDAPADLDRVIGHALAKDRSQRFQTAGQLGAAARAALHGSPQPWSTPAVAGGGRIASATPGSKRGRWLLVAALGAVAALAAAGGGAYVAFGRHTSTPQASVNQVASPAQRTAPTPAPGVASTSTCTFCDVVTSDGYTLNQAFAAFDHDCDPTSAATPVQCRAALSSAQEKAQTMLDDLDGLVPPARYAPADTALRTALGDFDGGVAQAQALYNASNGASLAGNPDWNSAFAQITEAEANARQQLALLPGGG